MRSVPHGEPSHFCKDRRGLNLLDRGPCCTAGSAVQGRLYGIRYRLPSRRWPHHPKRRDRQDPPPRTQAFGRLVADPDRAAEEILGRRSGGFRDRPQDRRGRDAEPGRSPVKTARFAQGQEPGRGAVCRPGGGEKTGPEIATRNPGEAAVCRKTGRTTWRVEIRGGPDLPHPIETRHAQGGCHEIPDGAESRLRKSRSPEIEGIVSVESRLRKNRSHEIEGTRLRRKPPPEKPQPRNRRHRLRRKPPPEKPRPRNRRHRLRRKPPPEKPQPRNRSTVVEIRKSRSEIHRLESRLRKNRNHEIEGIVSVESRLQKNRSREIEGIVSVESRLQKNRSLRRKAASRKTAAPKSKASPSPKAASGKAAATKSKASPSPKKAAAAKPTGGAKSRASSKAASPRKKSPASPSPSGGSRKTAPRKPEPPKPRSRSALKVAPKGKAAAKAPDRKVRGGKPAAPTGPAVGTVTSEPLMVSLAELNYSSCRWPIGDPGMEPFGFCGLPAVPSRPYCAVHVELAFQPPTSRRDRDRARNR